MHDVTIAPAQRIHGTVRIPGDKSISHRLAMLGAVAHGETVIHNFAESEDCQSTLKCLGQLGVRVHRSDSGATVRVEGRGFEGLQAPTSELNAGNSGSTVRMLSGILGGRPFASTFTGDASLSRRPMKRIIDPLEKLGATLTAREGQYLPLTIHGGALTAIEYTLPVASAQVKSAILLAALQARGLTRVVEPAVTRNHTELALAAFGAGITTRGTLIEVHGGARLQGGEFEVPGDLSSAAFLIAAAAAIPGSHLELPGIGVNPTRAGFLDLIQEMGAHVRIENRRACGNEPVGDLIVEGADLQGADIGGALIPNVIDEIPVLAVLALRTRDGIRFRNAEELRTKESDRIRAMVSNLAAIGVPAEEFADGFYVPGKLTPRGGAIDSMADHRIAMAFSVAALFAGGPITIRNADCVGISFPEFFRTLNDVTTR